MRAFLLFYTVILLFTVKASAAITTGDYQSNGSVDFSTTTNWQVWTGTTWIAATSLPSSVGSSNTITIQSGNTATVSGSISLNANIAISGTLNMTDGATLTVGSNTAWINFTVNSGGSFNMPGGSGNATLIVYGNYNNNGSTNFWKSNVIITGDLTSPSTSSLQNQGNVIVGGNIIGDFSLTGGTGSSQIYAVNPNATVTITPASVDNNVTPGTQPSSESSALVSLVNTVIYGNNSCSYTITDPSANIAVCSGTNTSVSISTSGTSTTPTYQWQVNSGSGWNDLSNGGNYSGVYTTTLSFINTPSAFNGYKYRVKVTSGCVKNGNYVTLTANALPVAPTSVTPNTGVAICNGSSTNLNATSSGTVSWYTSATGGSSLGTSASAANFSVSPTISTTYYAESQSTAGCISTARTATALVTVNPILSAGVVIAASPSGSICAGTNVTFTATPTNGGSSPSYQWYVGTTTVGTNSATYSSNSLANNDIVKVVMTSNASPCLAGSPATSNQVTMTVNPILSASVAIAASPSGSICAGTNVTFTATPANGGSNPSYQWYVGATAVGTNSATYSSNSLANNDIVKVVMTSNASPCLAGSPATSNQVTMTVNPILSASVAIAASPSASICPGTNVTFTATPANGGLNPSYQWYVGATTVGTNSATYSSNSLANNDIVKVVMTSNASPCLAGSPATSNQITMTVNPILSASVAIAASPSSSICAGTNVTFTATPANGGLNPSYQWYVGTTTVGTNSPTYSSNSLANNDIVKVVITSNASPCLSGSPATSNQVTMAVTPNLPVSVAISASPSGVISAGASVTFTATPTNGGSNPSYQWYVGTATVGTNSATYSSNSLANNDIVKVVMTSNASPCLSGSPATSNQITMTVNNDKTWTGFAGTTDWFTASNWTPNGVPTSTTDVIIPNTTIKILIASGLSASANTITILSGGKLDLDTTSVLTVKDKVDVNTGGALNLVSGASLIQINNTANSGTINVYRDSSKIILNDYTYWSSPTYGSQTLLNFSPNTNPKYFLAYSNGWIYLNASTTTFNPGTGYAILAPTDANASMAASKNFQFTGTPNNGNVSVHVDLNPNIFSSTLIGNPYPSAIDADKFISANTYDATTNPTGTISGTLYFWTHNSTYNGSYTANDYVSYNKSGQVVTTTAASGHANNLAPTQYIASCQGFVVQNVKSGNVVFTNAMRTSGSGAPTVNGNFYKNADASNTVLEKNRIWLNFTNNGGLNFSQMLVGYIETATNGYDPGFDGAYYSSGKTGMYSLIGNSRYAIQAKELPFTNTDIIPLGYTTNVKGDATISIDHVDGLFTSGQDIFIEDKLLNVVQNLRVSPYTFSSEAGTFNSRFVLKYICNYLGVSDIEGASDNLVISSANQQIKIHSDGELIDKVFVYDMLGKEIFQSNKINANDTLISDPKTQQVLIVKVVLANGRSVNRKVIY